MTNSNNNYDARYKAHDVPSELRAYYNLFNQAKYHANILLAENDLPFIVRLKKAGDFQEQSLWANLTLDIYRRHSNGYTRKIYTKGLTKNQIRIECNVKSILKKIDAAWQKFEHKDDVDQQLEALAMYHLAYE